MINEKFYELEKEKQDKIINAAIEVFAKNDYKNVVTEEITYKAEISKGLLFYYFKNKKICIYF
ncbi:TetR/AcrR family transcriptional regulator [Anaerofustis sp. NSJ-163]|uniref:TetR/AcrR family transcriptional regulator n=1 Tax=Anaerofustis sp. NSJ-163 TaxID=2944391 RepID=UPI00209BDFF6|nr:TetR/AcrR family transcriptional regulator [Anaerofustis sp. NSJ-163]MCO8194112.1 TetR/AcrR family transcriptional regulator [Anaerofustis sp. NSJ-163]